MGCAAVLMRLFLFAADFGLARMYGIPQQPMTPRVVTLWWVESSAGGYLTFDSFSKDQVLFLKKKKSQCDVLVCSLLLFIISFRGFYLFGIEKTPKKSSYFYIIFKYKHKRHWLKSLMAA